MTVALYRGLIYTYVLCNVCSWSVSKIKSFLTPQVTWRLRSAKSRIHITIARFNQFSATRTSSQAAFDLANSKCPVIFQMAMFRNNVHRHPHQSAEDTELKHLLHSYVVQSLREESPDLKQHITTPNDYINIQPGPYYSTCKWIKPSDFYT